MAGLLPWLGKQLHGIEAQINPWDNGATYSSVVNAPAQPQQQSQPQQTVIAPQTYARMSPQARQRIANADASVIKSAQNVYNPGAIAGDVFKASADLGKNLVAGLQQGAGRIGDVAIEGGTALSQGANLVNPFIGDQHRQQLINQSSNADAALRNALHGAKDIQGQNLAGVSGADQAGANIAAGRGNLRDAATVGGTGLQVGLDATTFANPGKAFLAGNAGKLGVKPILGQVAKESGLYGGTAGLSSGAQTYGQTGNPVQALEEAAKNTVLSGGAQALLGGGGYALGRGTRVAAPVMKDTAQTVADTANSMRPAIMAANHPAVLGYDPQYSQLAQQFDHTADPVARQQISQAMAQNRADRLATQNAITRQISQGGYHKIPFSGDQQPLPLESAVPSEPTRPQSIPQQPQDIPRTQVPLSAVPAETGQSSQLEQALGIPSVNNTPNPSNTQAYLKEQTALQKQARDAGNPSLPTKIRNEISTKLIDSLAPIENTLKQANKAGANIQIGDANHITPQLDRALRADTIAGQYMRDNGLHKVIQNVKDPNALDQYLIAKHAADLEKQGIKTGRNLQADQQLIKDLAPTYEPHAQAIMKYNQGLLDTAANYGLISKDLAASLKKQYPNYVPVNRIFGEGEKPQFNGAGGGKASRSTQTAVQRIKGSTRQIESPLSSIAAKTQDIVKQGEVNKAASILASYKDLPGNPFSLRELKPSETVGAKPTIAFLDNGKVRRFETTPEIEAAAKSLNKEQIGILGKIVRVPTRILRLGATGINVGFAMANVTKDMVSAIINSRHPFETSALNPKILGKAFDAATHHSGKDYAELLRQGAGGTSFDIARDAPVQNVARIRADKNLGTKALYTARHPGELLRAVENTIGRSEEFTRALQYFGNKEAALKQGMSQADAARYGAHYARNNTVNFARAGEYGAVLNSALPYLNAGIQGSRTFLRNVKERPVQTLTKVAIFSTLPAATTTAWNLSDPKRAAAYKDISEYEKQGNLIILPPNPQKDPKTGRWNAIKIPVSQEIANLNNIARNAVEQGFGAGQVDPATVLGDLIGTATSLNVQTPRQVLGQVTPQAIKPGIETITNQNLFTGNKIVPDSQKNLPAQDQYGDYTSGTAKVLGKTLGLSPRQIDNGIRTTTGGAGQTALNASDSALAALGLIKPNEVQGRNLPDTVSGRFFGASSIPASDSADKAFQDASKKLIASPQYQALSQQDKAKALNRLQRDTQAITYNQYDANNPNSSYTPNKLTKNQQALQSGTRKPTDYTQPSTGGSSVQIAKGLDKQSSDILAKYGSTKDRTQWFNKQNDAEYQYTLAKYQNDKANGMLTPAQDIKAQKELRSAKIGAQYSKNVRDLHSLSKADLATYLATPEKGVDKQKLAQDLLAYDKALYDSGASSTLKFKYGIASKGKGGSKGRKGGKKGGRKGSDVAAGKALVSLTAQMNKIRVPHTTGTKAPSGKISQPKLAKSSLKKYTVAKVKVGKPAKVLA